jgi:hypothetical protein
MPRMGAIDYSLNRQEALRGMTTPIHAQGRGGGTYHPQPGHITATAERAASTAN